LNGENTQLKMKFKKKQNFDPHFKLDVVDFKVRGQKYTGVG
jgi:hypothetical protein